MNPFANRIQTQQQWILPVTAMSLILGVMTSMAWVSENNRSVRLARLDPDARLRVTLGGLDLDKVAQLEAEVTSLREEKTKLQGVLTERDGKGKVLGDELDKAELLAGLTALEGPGVQVTLRDSTKGPQSFGGIQTYTNDSIIHDSDVLKVVNELNATGAEAVSVNGHRVVGGSSFRCVGTTILVDGIRIASPVVIRAIGDAATLMGGMNLPGGELSEIRQTDPDMVDMIPMKKLQLPPFAGTTERKFGVVPKVTKETK